MTTLQALLATAIGIVPGAVYVAAYDGQVGQGRSSLPDRLTRYITTSAGLHALLALASYRIWRLATSGEIGPLLDRHPLLAFVPGVLYVLLPAASGVASAAVARSTGRSLLGNLLARLPRSLSLETVSAAPSAWDHLFTGSRLGYVRVRLKTGGWVGGYWGKHQHRDIGSHAAVHPDPPELFLAHLADVGEAGQLVTDQDGNVQLYDEGLLVRWEDVDVVKFAYIDAEPATEGFSD